MINNVTKIVVKHNNIIVGYLAELSETAIAFQYDSSWLEDGFSISPFSLPLSNKVFYNSKPIFNGLFGVFHDSMPDGWGEILLRRFLAKKGFLCRGGVGWFLLVWFCYSPSKNLFKIILIFIELSSLIIVSSNS